MYPQHKIVVTTTLLSIAVFTACNKQDRPKPETPPAYINIPTLEVAKCHTDNNYKTEEIEAALVGRWNFIQKDCKSIYNYYTTYLNINKDKSYVLVEGGKVRASGTWFLEQDNDGNTLFRVSDYLDYLEPLLTICGNQLILALDEEHKGSCVVYYQRD